MIPLRRLWARMVARDRRAISIAALVLLPALGFVYAVRPAIDSFERLRGRVVQERDLYQRERDLLSQQAALEQRYQEAAAVLLDESPRLFSGRDSVTTSADVVSYVTGLAALNRVFVQASAATSTDVPVEGVLRVRVEIRAVGDLAGLTAWLTALENGRKLVGVRSLSVVPAMQVGQPGQQEIEMLGLTLVVEGYALQEAAGADPRLATVEGVP
jgi:hypothetical protein